VKTFVSTKHAVKHPFPERCFAVINVLKWSVFFLVLYVIPVFPRKSGARLPERIVSTEGEPVEYASVFLKDTRHVVTINITTEVRRKKVKHNDEIIIYHNVCFMGMYGFARADGRFGDTCVVKIAIGCGRLRRGCRAADVLQR
jgi:hypothetical protein